jgi:hypothetical protein
MLGFGKLSAIHAGGKAAEHVAILVGSDALRHSERWIEPRERS